MLKERIKTWHLWTTIGHHSEIEFCQFTDTPDFKFEFVKIFLRKFC